MGDENSPFVSIVIPCRNEEKFIGKCLDSIIGNHFPQDRLEVLVVDGMSDDGTQDVISEYTCKYSCIKRLVNPDRITPRAMNIGIKGAKGDVVIFVNAHCILDKDFLKFSIEYLEKTGADAPVFSLFSSLYLQSHRNGDYDQVVSILFDVYIFALDKYVEHLKRLEFNPTSDIEIEVGFRGFIIRLVKNFLVGDLKSRTDITFRNARESYTGKQKR